MHSFHKDLPRVWYNVVHHFLHPISKDFCLVFVETSNHIDWLKVYNVVCPFPFRDQHKKSRIDVLCESSICMKFLKPFVFSHICLCTLNLCLRESNFQAHGSLFTKFSKGISFHVPRIEILNYSWKYVPFYFKF